MSSFLSLLSLFVVFFQSSQGLGQLAGGWSPVPTKDLSVVQEYVNEVRDDIIALMQADGNNLSTACKITVTSAQQQVWNMSFY